MLRRCCSLACTLLLALSLTPSTASLVEHSALLGLDQVGPSSSVVALGDFNSDKHCDLVVLSSANSTAGAHSTLALWMWHANPGQFLLAPSASATITLSNAVTNAIALDFDFDGKLDLLVASPTVDTWSRAATSLTVYLGTGEGFLPTPVTIQAAAGRGGVHVLDANNDLRPDLFGERYALDAVGVKPDHGSGLTVRSYWIAQTTDPAAEAMARLRYSLQSQPLDAAPLSPHSAFAAPLSFLANPSSHANVDIDGDCMQDLVVTSTDMIAGEWRQFVEIWINDASRGLRFHSRSILPPGAGQLHFADVDNDGALDLVLPVFAIAQQGGDRIEVYFNDQRGVCGSAVEEAAGSGCRLPSALCVADHSFRFEFFNFTDESTTPSHDSSNYAAYHFPAATANGGRMFDPSALPGADATSITSTPFQLRTSDINLDGFPDVLLSLTPHSTATGAPAAEYGVAQLWHNVPCVAATATSATEPSIVCSAAAQRRGRRIFSGTAAGLSAANSLLASIHGAYAGASFIDVADDGDVDILFSAIQPVRSVTGTGALPAAGTHSTHVFVNTFHEDAYFLTVLASNGVCPAWCPTEPRFPSPKPYGTPAVGGTVKFSYSDLSGSKHASIGTQVSQSRALTLSTPYCTFGLGRTNTFIDTFFFGIGLNQTRHSRSWTSLVPNAQVVLFPYPPSDPDQWTLELFVAPSSQLLWVCVSWAATMTLLAMVIAVLHLKEKREDEQEKRKHQLLFTF